MTFLQILQRFLEKYVHICSLPTVTQNPNPFYPESYDPYLESPEPFENTDTNIVCTKH